MKCPKCSCELHATATYCGCGWRAGVRGKREQSSCPEGWSWEAQKRATTEQAMREALAAGYGSVRPEQALAALKAFRLKTW